MRVSIARVLASGIFIVGLLAFYLLASGGASTESGSSRPTSHIVLLDSSVKDPGMIAHRQAERYGMKLTHVYKYAVKGYSAMVSSADAEALAEEPQVRYVQADDLLETASEGEEETPPQDSHDVLRDGSAHNANFDLDGKDDFRVDADIAIFDKGMWESAKLPNLNLVHRVDCVNPDPWRESLGQYEHPNTEDPEWEADEQLNESADPSYGAYGCLDNSGEPYADQTSPDGGIHGVGVADRAAQIDAAVPQGSAHPSLGGPAAGARIWSVRVLDREENFGGSIDPASYPVTISGAGIDPASMPGAPVTCGQSQFQMVHEDVDSPGSGAKLELSAEYSECMAFGFAATVAMNSCHYDLDIQNVGPPYKAKWGIACAKEGDAIETVVSFKSKVICTEKVGVQKESIEGVGLGNTGEGKGRGITVNAEVGGVEYTLSGSNCGHATGSFKDGEFHGSTTLYGANPAEEQRAVQVAGTGGAVRLLRQPRFFVGIEYLPEVGTSHVIAGLDWVVAQGSKIDVVEMALGCAQKGTPVVEEEEAGLAACDSTVLNEAIATAVDHGIVVSVAAGNNPFDVELGTPRNDPDAMTVSNVADNDGKPGGEGGIACGVESLDDHRNVNSSFGALVDVAATPHCGGTSGASGKAAGSAAALASQCDPHNREGVEFIVDTLMAEGDTGEIDEGGWKDDSGDAWKEPFLNLSNEEVFDPVMENTETHKLNHEPEQSCVWRSHQAESDVGSDGRADLVTIDSEGDAKVYTGAYEGPVQEPAADGFDIAHPTTSLKGEVDPALLDGTGHYAIDTADVDGDRHADLVTIDEEGVWVHRGKADGSFEKGILALDEGGVSMNGAGPIEPIAVADVNGDQKGDLITLLGPPSAGYVLTLPGKADGTFGAPLTSSLGIDPALLDGKGSYFLDVIDVDGEQIDANEPIDYNARHSYADLVTMNTSGTVSVYKGQPNGTFSKTAVTAASINPIMDDGKGAEPIGLGDVNRDRRADLLTLEGETLKLYKAKSDGSFEAPSESYEGKVDSSLLDGKGSEPIGLLDYTRDGLADLVSVSEEGEVLTYAAQRDSTFAEPVAQEGTIPSVRHSSGGSEFVAEKPFLRRGECDPTGCHWLPAVAPVAAYSFDEGEGSVARDSAGHHDGTIQNATWTSSGKYGSALDFNGTNALVSIADASDLDLTSSFTLEAWVRPDNFTGSRAVISKRESAGSGYSGYLLKTEPGGAPFGGVYASGASAGVTGSSALTSATWSHLALTSNGTTLRLYVNGSLVSTAAAIAAAPTAATLKIGYNQQYFDGLIDEVRVYGRPLNRSQIQVDRDKAVGPPPPVAAYSFDEGEGSVARDSAGHHDGTIQNATWTSSGKYGSALDFNGTNALVSIADASDLDLTSSFTLEAWVRPDVLGSGRPAIVKQEKPGSETYGYILNPTMTAGKPGGKVAKSGASATVNASSALPTATWSHLAFTSDGTTLRFYVNGELVATQTAVAAAPTAANLEIGRNAVAAGYFDGLIDDVRIYDRPLGVGQIQADRDAGV